MTKAKQKKPKKAFVLIVVLGMVMMLTVLLLGFSRKTQRNLTAADDFLKSTAGSQGGLSDTAIDELVEARLQARANKDWANADRIRDELVEAGIVIEDGNDGTRCPSTLPRGP